MRRLLLGVWLCLLAGSPASAAVVVIGNFTPVDVPFTVAEPGQKPRPLQLAAYHVIPVAVSGPADVTFADRGSKTTLRLDPYNAFAFIPDPNGGVRLEGVELPGKPPAGDPNPAPPPAEPVKIPVTLMVDEKDPRADQFWQAAVRAQFDDAARIVEAHSGVRFEFAGFGTWKADPGLADLGGLLEDFETKVAVKPGRLAIGWVSRMPPEKDDGPFGLTRGVPATHVIVRHGRLTDPSEQIEVLTQLLGTTIGAVPVTDDPGSVMRAKLGDGMARRKGFVTRFDPLNALAMNIWAEELRRGPVSPGPGVTAANRARLMRVYRAILRGTPGEALALRYLDEFDRNVARGADVRPAPVRPIGDPARPMPKDLAQPVPDAAARRVALAVVARARANAGPARLTGDELTAAYVAAAADEALKLDEAERVSAFLVGLGVALDDAGLLITDPHTVQAVESLEPATDRADRMEVLGVPTLRGRRDLCRRFVVGIASGELLPPHTAEASAVARFLADRQRAGGACFPNLAAELAGAEFARTLRNHPDLLPKLRDGSVLAGFLPPTDGLRDGLSADRFEEDYGDVADDRFKAALADLRQRAKKAAAPR